MTDNPREAYEYAKSRMERAEHRQRNSFVGLLVVLLLVVVGFGVVQQVQAQHSRVQLHSQTEEILSIVQYIKTVSGPASAKQLAAEIGDVEHCILDESAHGNGLTTLPFPVPPGCQLGKVVAPSNSAAMRSQVGG